MIIIIIIIIIFFVRMITLEATTNLNQIFTHDFYLENLSQVRNWASQVTCNPPPLVGGLPPPLKINILPISSNPNQILTHDF